MFKAEAKVEAEGLLPNLFFLPREDDGPCLWVLVEVDRCWSVLVGVDRCQSVLVAIFMCWSVLVTAGWC